MLRELGRRLLMLLHRRQFDADLEEEMRLHRELREQGKVAEGLTPEQAHYAVARRFGNPLALREESREMWGWNWLENLAQDIRFGLRMLAKNPGFTTVAVLTLALGLGANTAIFSLVNSVLLRPLPYPDPSRLVHAQWLFPHGDVPSVTATEFEFWKEHSRVFESAAAVDLFPSGFNLVAGDEAEYVKALKVSRDFFRTLGVQPFLGRGFTAEEDRPNGPKTVILGYGLWQRRFGSDPGLVGHVITLDNQSYSVIGVLPRGFEFVLQYAAVENVDAWVPLGLVADPRDNGHDFTMLARLKPRVGLEQAQADMTRVLAEIRQDVPGHVAPGERGMLLVPYQKWVTGDVRTPLLILFAAVGLVLLIATVNVANLILARAVTRQPEVSVRLALGASGGRVLRQLLTENILLALIGGGVALVAAPWAVRALVSLAPQDVPLVGTPNIDFKVLTFTLLIAAAGGVAAGLVPALGASRSNLSQSIKQGARTGTVHSGHRLLRSCLVTGEVALSVLLLTGAALLILSLAALAGVNPGFNPRGLSTFHLWLPAPKFQTAAASWDFDRKVIARLGALPGVESASVASALPLEPGLNGDVRVATGGGQKHVYVEKRSASPGYFTTMQIPVLRGRAFTDSDTPSAPLVVIVNQAFAKACCAGRDVLGSLVAFRTGAKGELGREVVGVIGDTREEAIAAAAPPMVFIPVAQVDDRLALEAFFHSSWVVRSPVPLGESEVRRAIAQVDPGEAVADFGRMSSLVAESIGLSRFVATLMSAFAGLALLLAAIGLYGVLSYSVAERTHEFGLRMALGAERRDVLGMVLRQGMRVALLGAGIGLALAFALTRLLRDLLFGVRPTDPLALLLVAAILTGVALLACYLPARRATKVDPMVALRYE